MRTERAVSAGCYCCARGSGRRPSTTRARVSRNCTPRTRPVATLTHVRLQRRAERCAARRRRRRRRPRLLRLWKRRPPAGRRAPRTALGAAWGGAAQRRQPARRVQRRGGLRGRACVARTRAARLLRPLLLARLCRRPGSVCRAHSDGARAGAWQEQGAPGRAAHHDPAVAHDSARPRALVCRRPSCAPQAWRPPAAPR